MKVIEMSYTFLFYYKEENIQSHQKLYEKIMEQIDLSRKKYKSEKHKQEEKQRELELYKKLEAKKDRIIFRPRRQDLYSNLIIIEKMKKEERKRTKMLKRTLIFMTFCMTLMKKNKIINNKIQFILKNLMIIIMLLICSVFKYI